MYNSETNLITKKVKIIVHRKRTSRDTVSPKFSTASTHNIESRIATNAQKIA